MHDPFIARCLTTICVCKALAVPTISDQDHSLTKDYRLPETPTVIFNED